VNCGQTLQGPFGARYSVVARRSSITRLLTEKDMQTCSSWPHQQPTRSLPHAHALISCGFRTFSFPPPEVAVGGWRLPKLCASVGIAFTRTSAIFPGRVITQAVQAIFDLVHDFLDAVVDGTDSGQNILQNAGVSSPCVRFCCHAKRTTSDYKSLSPVGLARSWPGPRRRPSQPPRPRGAGRRWWP